MTWAQWRKNWVKVSSELTQDRRAWVVPIRDDTNSIGDYGSTHPQGEHRCNYKQYNHCDSKERTYA